MSTEEPTDGGPDDLLETGRPLPGWVRVLAAALAVLGLGYLGVRALHSGDAGHPVAAPQPSQLSQPRPSPQSPHTAPPLLRFPGGPKMVRTTGCGPDLPPVQVQAGSASTGLRLLVGGGLLQRVDFDTGHTLRLRGQPQLPANEWFDSFARGSAALYATASTVPCEIMNTELMAVRGSRTTLVSLAPSSGVIADGSRVWTLRDPPHVLSPVTGGRDVPLPAGFVPVAATRGLVVGNLVSAMDPDEIIAVDTRSGRLKAISGAIGSILAVGDGRVYWTSRCATDAPCRLLSAAARGGSERRFRLPAPPAGTPGQLSPDGRHLALVVDHVPDGRPRSPALAGDVALLDLRSGRLQVVPGLALPTRYRPSFAFAPGGWLVVGYEHDGVSRLVAWRPGLTRAVQSPFHATSPAAPPIAVPAG